jgi:hypothetical protein
MSHPIQCHLCGRFIGKDGNPDVFWDDYNGGWECGYPKCGPCLRKENEGWSATHQAEGNDRETASEHREPNPGPGRYKLVRIEGDDRDGILGPK